MTYWSLVAGLWIGIGGVGTIAYVGAHLPPIQSLEIPEAAAVDPDRRLWPAARWRAAATWPARC